MLGMITTDDPTSSGLKDIAGALGGGIKENSLMLIEGEARSGKSVISQHIAFSVLERGTPVAFYSSDCRAEGLVTRLSSFSLDIKKHLLSDNFRVIKIYSKSVLRKPEKSLELIIRHIGTLPPRFKLIIIDSPSVYFNMVAPVVKIDFLQACKDICNNDRSVVLVVDESAMEHKTRSRAGAMSDYFLNLHSQDSVLADGKIDTRIIKMMEVTKLAGADCWGRPPLKFEIKPGVGIQILPLLRVRI